MKLKPIKVSLLNQYIKKYLKSNSLFHNLNVEGEISNFRISKTGYSYFNLSDESSSINCVCFFIVPDIKDGDKVTIQGELSVYEAKGSYQIISNSVEKTGKGDILKELELLKKKLYENGMFENNKVVPLLPSKIGVIASKNSAAVKDILKTFDSVSCSFEVFIFDSLVQGENAKKTILEGIDYFNLQEKTDLIVLSRGGGSFEDLKIFNDIEIAEKIFLSKIPIITGIGHETDVTLSDYTADVRCHTPTAAAEYVIRGYKNLNTELLNLYQSLQSKKNYILTQLDTNLNKSKFILKTYDPQMIVLKLKNQCDINKATLNNFVFRELNNRQNELNILFEKLSAHNYKKMLNNGYALVFDKKNELLKTKDDFLINEEILIKFDNFEIEAKVKKIREGSNER